jgi:site-specific DNA-methyltransferase (adenine-specific)
MENTNYNDFEGEEEGCDVIEVGVFKVKVNTIKPHPVSLRIYDYRHSFKSIKLLASTMKLIGQLEPIRINTDNEIISGVRRWKAAKLLGLEEIDAIRVKKTKNEEDTIVFYNQQRRKRPIEIINEAESYLGILGKNQGVRNDLLGTDVKRNPFGKIGRDRFEIAAKLIGDISPTSLRRIMSVVDFEKESDENKSFGLVDKIINEELSPSRAQTLIRQIQDQRKERTKRKKVDIKPSTSTDDYSTFNKSSASMKEVKSNSVQVVFTSPPYFNLRNYGNGTENNLELGHEDNINDFIKNLTNHFKDVKRVLKKSGSFFLNIGDTYAKGENLLVPTRLLLSLCDNEGWFLVNEIIWKKTNALPQPTERRLQPTYEKIFHLVKDPDEYYYNEFKLWNNNEMRVVQAPGGRNSSSSGRVEGGLTISRSYKKFRDFIDEQSVKDVITGPNAASRQMELRQLDLTADHPALMPDYLPIIPILTTSKPNDIILDPFSGSATTGKVALLLGRKYVGYELNQENYELGNRLLDLTQRDFLEDEVNIFNQYVVDNEVSKKESTDDEIDDFFADL